MSNEELVILINAGIDKKDNLKQLYLQNNGLISKLAIKYAIHNDYEDLIQEGYLGLVYAAEHYDPEDGASFSTYAFKCIRGYMLRFMHGNNNSIKIPEPVLKRIHEYKDYISSYKKKYGKDPDVSKVIRALHITIDQVDEIKRVILLLSPDISIEQAVTDDDSETYADIIPDDGNQIDDLLDDIEKQELNEKLWDIVDHLQGQQPEVIRMRFQGGKTLKECSQVLHLSAERVRAIQRDGCKKIRQVHSKDLLPYYHDYIYSQGLKHTSFSDFKYTNESSVERAVRLLEEHKHGIE